MYTVFIWVNHIKMRTYILSFPTVLSLPPFSLSFICSLLLVFSLSFFVSLSLFPSLPLSASFSLQAWDSLCRGGGSDGQQWDLWSRSGLQRQDWRYSTVEQRAIHVISLCFSSILSFNSSRFLTAKTAEIPMCAASVLFWAQFERELLKGNSSSTSGLR